MTSQYDPKHLSVSKDLNSKKSTHSITGQPPSQVCTFLGVGSSETIHLLPPTYCTVKPPIIHYPL